MQLKPAQLKVRPGTAISLIVLGLAVLCALVPQLFTSQDPNQGGDTTALLAPSFHWFGTDAVGRDLYTRVVYGARQSLLGALLAVLFGLVVGTLLGVIAGVNKGWLDAAIMRVVDVLLSILHFCFPCRSSSFWGTASLMLRSQWVLPQLPLSPD